MSDTALRRPPNLADAPKPPRPARLEATLWPDGPSRSLATRTSVPMTTSACLPASSASISCCRHFCMVGEVGTYLAGRVLRAHEISRCFQGKKPAKRQQACMTHAPALACTHELSAHGLSTKRHLRRACCRHFTSVRAWRNTSDAAFSVCCAPSCNPAIS
eukprot:6210724-Pleurochrysis_carterae.AAC.3